MALAEPDPAAGVQPKLRAKQRVGHKVSCPMPVGFESLIKF